LDVFDWIWTNAAKLRDLAAIVGVVGTIIGVAVAVWRARIERRLQREVNAKRTYAAVLRLAFDFPDFAEPSPQLHVNPQLKTKYFWYVVNVLNALDEILVSTDEAVWRKVAQTFVRHHAAWLSTDEFKTLELLHYNEELRSIIDVAPRFNAAASTMMMTSHPVQLIREVSP
jgi:hypothetical protein